MDRVWLRFKSCDLERQYDAYMFRGLFWRSDGRFLWFTVAFLTAMFCEPTPSSTHKVFYVVMILAFIWAALWRREKEAQTLMAQRTAFVMGVKLFHQVMMALARPFMCHAFALPSNTLLAVARTLMMNDVMCFVMNSLVFRLKFRYHIFFNTPLMVIMLFSRVKTFCHCALQSPGGPGLLEVERIVDIFARGSSSCLHAPYVLFMRTRGPYVPCYQIAMFIQLFFGIFVTSYVMWVLEHRSRVHFILHMRANQNAVELPDIAHLRASWFRHFTTIGIVMVLSWDYCDWVPAIIQKWGILVFDD
ncbi:hypothetical protein BSKO_03155 [Bryopsis sp. KO-2023]|nr:hypothetical protein BSKO_03155 [Bryopsis sp. KO-2023]